MDKPADAIAVADVVRVRGEQQRGIVLGFGALRTIEICYPTGNGNSYTRAVPSRLVIKVDE